MLHATLSSLLMAASALAPIGQTKPGGTPPAGAKRTETRPTGRFEYAGAATSFLSETPLGLPSPAALKMRPPEGKGCPPRCAFPAVPLEEVAVLVRPIGADVAIGGLTLFVVDAQNQVVAQTDPACRGCGRPLSALKDPKAGHLFRLDAAALKSLAPVYKEHPGHLEFQIDGKGQYTVHAVRVGK